MPDRIKLFIIQAQVVSDTLHYGNNRILSIDV